MNVELDGYFIWICQQEAQVIFMQVMTNGACANTL